MPGVPDNGAEEVGARIASAGVLVIGLSQDQELVRPDAAVAEDREEAGVFPEFGYTERLCRTMQPQKHTRNIRNTERLCRTMHV